MQGLLELIFLKWINSNNLDWCFQLNASTMSLELSNYLEALDDNSTFNVSALRTNHFYFLFLIITLC